jgi:WD40 repeat protein
MTPKNLFQVGGAIPIGRLYIERRADTEVVETLLEGEFCSVLAPRQIGKSSLRLRAAKRLEARGIRCVSIDFSGIGSSVTVDEWYFSIAYEIAEELGLPDPELFWTQHNQLTPVHRWYRFIRNELLDRIDEPVVVFIDEVDSVLALSFTTDDFFASIRSAYNLRAEDPAYRRLTFCLLGVAAPTDLIQNPVRTPFNIGRGIRIDDFTRGELDAFTPGLQHLGRDTPALLNAVYAWTSGHPYMAQRLCEELARRGTLYGQSEADAVDDAAYLLFLRGGRQGDPSLAYAEKRLDKGTARARVRQLLHTYRQLLNGERVLAEPNSPVQTELRLMGIAAERTVGNQLHLTTRNLIFAEVYDLAWLKDKEKEHRLAESVERWIAAGKPDAWLLRGASLEDALSWSRGRSDLMVSEHEFLLSSISLARREAEDRQRIAEAERAEAEARRKEEQARRSLVEQERRIQEQRYLADIERERRQRAEDAASSQRRAITILTVTVAALGALLGVALWQFVLARTTKIQLADANLRAKREAGETQLLRRASEALLLAQQPGLEIDALSLAIEAAGEALIAGRGVPSRVREALVNAVAIPPRRPLILRHNEPIEAARFSRDGTRVLTTSRDRASRLWDAVSGKAIAALDEHGDVVLSAVFAGGDGKILTASADRSVRLWSPSGEPLRVFATADPALERAEISADGERVLTVSRTRPPRLWDATTGKVIATLKGHRGATQARLSPGGGRVLSVDVAGRARLWSSRSGELIAELPSRRGGVRGAEFAPDDQRLVSFDAEGARLWTTLGAPLADLRGHRGAVVLARFSGAGDRILTYAIDGEAILWETHAGREIARFSAPGAPLLDAAFSADGRLLATAHEDGAARLWSCESGQLLSTMTGHEGPVQGVRFSPKGGKIATYGVDRSARLWGGDGDLLAVLEGHLAPITALEFSPNGQLIATVARSDNTARIWDASLRSPIPTLKGHRAPLRRARFAPDGQHIVTLSDDRSARLWRARDQALLRALPEHGGPVIDAVFTADSAVFATLAEADPIARLWDRDGLPIAELRGHVAPVLDLAFTRDGAEAITAGADDTIRRWRVRDGQLLATCDGLIGALRLAVLDRHGERLLSVGRDSGVVQLWDAGLCRYIEALSGHSGLVESAAFTADGLTVATASRDGTTRLWDTRYGTSLAIYEGDGDVAPTIAFAPDGDRLLTAGLREAWVRDAVTGQLVATLSGHSAAIRSAAFSADGALIVTASGDNTARLWDATSPTYDLVGTLAGHAATVDWAEFSPSGRDVLTASRDGTAKLFPTQLVDTLSRACELVRPHPDAFARVRRYCDPRGPK